MSHDNTLTMASWLIHLPFCLTAAAQVLYLPSPHGNRPVLHCCGAQKHEVPFDDVIGLSQPLLPVLQGQFGFGQVMTRLVVFGHGQPFIGDTESPQPLLVSGWREDQYTWWFIMKPLHTVFDLVLADYTQMGIGGMVGRLQRQKGLSCSTEACRIKWFCILLLPTGGNQIKEE